MKKYTEQSILKDIVSTRQGRKILEETVPRFHNYPNLIPCLNTSLRELAEKHHMGLVADDLPEILARLNSSPYISEGQSLDEIERETYGAGVSPMEGEFAEIELSADNSSVSSFAGAEFLLDGIWELAEKENPDDVWEEVLPVRVPGSIHAALTEAGKLPDTTVGRNQELGQQVSYRDWWLRRKFSDSGMESPVLCFRGVCNRCDVWLNGEFLGSHEGMFGSFCFELRGKLMPENTLAVHLYAIPFRQEPTSDVAAQLNEGSNDSWKDTVVFNNVYGWHYSKMPSMGIWQSVTIQDRPAVRLDHPFIATEDLEQGQMKLITGLISEQEEIQGELIGSIEPENFEGQKYRFIHPVSEKLGKTEVKLTFHIPQVHLWWPNDLGSPDLYQLKLTLIQDGNVLDHQEIVFGVRTVTMAPLPGGPSPDRYNWTFVVNHRPTFIKGSGWCTLDALMNFSRERYDRYLSLCRDQHIQMLRGWGSGMPETDDFYDLCDRYGIMVLQEWPTAWNSHETQPFDMIEETVRQNTLRLRNHASLVMWGGGNESPWPYGKLIDLMGRYAIELDGTRPFHRGEPWGGSEHDYSCWWGRKDLNYNAKKEAVFHGEFGLACLPNYESVLRYLPEEEQNLWPVIRGGGFEYHTPVFGNADDLNRLMQYAGYFIDLEHTTLQEFTIASQLATATGVRHPLERSRARWPECTGALYYKINDNFPAASWSCIDWYGATKMGHFAFQDAFEPLHAAILFDTLDFLGTPQELPVWLLDDTDELRNIDWCVNVRIYDGELTLLRKEEFYGSNRINRNQQVGTLFLSWQETDNAPLLFVAEVTSDGEILDRTFYWCNFVYKKGCLFHLPKTQLQTTIDKTKVSITNIGEVPAVAVQVSCPEYSDHFTVSDSYFWLEPGDTVCVETNYEEGIEVFSWNS